MQSMGNEPSVSAEVTDTLRAYRALDSPVRLRMFTYVQASPAISFNILAKKLHLASGLAAYHVGVLRAADLVAVSYERDGKAISQYKLTDRGLKIYNQLFSTRNVAVSLKRAASAGNASGKVAVSST